MKDGDEDYHWGEHEDAQPTAPRKSAQGVMLQALNLTITEAARSLGISRKTRVGYPERTGGHQSSDGRLPVDCIWYYRWKLAGPTASVWPWYAEKGRKQLQVTRLTAAWRGRRGARLSTRRPPCWVRSRHFNRSSTYQFCWWRCSPAFISSWTVVGFSLPGASTGVSTRHAWVRAPPL